MTDETGRFSLLGRRRPPHCAVRVVTVLPRRRVPYDDKQWRRALVVVEQGELEVVCRTGERQVFAEGAVLFFDGLDLRWLANPGHRPLVMTALSFGER